MKVKNSFHCGFNLHTTVHCQNSEILYCISIEGITEIFACVPSMESLAFIGDTSAHQSNRPCCILLIVFATRHMCTLASQAI